MWRSSSRRAVPKRLPVAEMIVLDANILIRAVLGKRVRQLLETYTAYRFRFYASDVTVTASAGGASKSATLHVIRPLEGPR